VVKNFDLFTSLDKITSPVTDFVRSNPLISTAIIGAGTAGLFATAVTIRKSRLKGKKAKVKKRRVTKKKNGRRKKAKPRGRGRRRVTHAKPRHKGHKRVSFTTKTGQKVNFLVRRKGGKTHKRRKKR